MFHFPFSTMHELNLDWFLEEWKKFRDSFSSNFAALAEILLPTQTPTVRVEYDLDTGVNTFIFGIPETTRPTQTTISYAKSMDGVNPPTSGWSSAMPVDKEGFYIWTRCVVKYNNGYEYTYYGVAYNGVNGSLIYRYEQAVSAGTTTYTITDPAIKSDFIAIDANLSIPRFQESDINVTTSDGEAVITLTVGGNATLRIDLAKAVVN